MIMQGRLCDFVCEVNTIKNEEELWNIWLHRVYDKSFDDWKNSLQANVQNENFDVEETVGASFDILKGFTPEKGR